MKKILILRGGGRPHGNTELLCASFADGAQSAGHEVDNISLAAVKVNGCLGCGACRYGKPCIQKDGFVEILPMIKAADLLVFASPLYYWTISSRLKAVIERFLCLAEPDENPPLGRYEKYPAKDCALLMTAADNLFWTFEHAVNYYKFTLVHYIGFRDKGMILAGGCGELDDTPHIKETNYLKDAFEFGEKIY